MGLVYRVNLSQKPQTKAMHLSWQKAYLASRKHTHHKLGMIVHTCNLCIWEMEAGLPQLIGCLRPDWVYEILPQNNNNKNNLGQ